MTKNWERYRVAIINLYKQQNLPLHEVKRILQEQYGFTASIRAYRTRFIKWGVFKYNCQRERRRNSSSTQWTSESGGLTPSPRTIPAVAMLNGGPGPLPMPVPAPLSRPGDGNSSQSSSYSPDLSPTASLSSYPGTPPTPGENGLSYQDDGKVASFLPPSSSLDLRHPQPLSSILPQVHSQAPGVYNAHSPTETSPVQSSPYPYYGPSGYFGATLPRYQEILHESVKHEYP